MKNLKINTLFIITSVMLSIACSCDDTLHRPADAASDVAVLSGGQKMTGSSRPVRKGGKYVQTYRTDDGQLSLSYSSAEPTGAVMLECAFSAGRDIDSLSMELSFWSLPPESIRERFCTPFSLPYLRDAAKNIIPDRFISNAETCSNTFSLITDSATYSVSILPVPEKMNRIYDPADAGDYSVALLSSEGTIRVKGIFGKNIPSGSTVTRRLLISTSQNTPGCVESGYHIGEYMNLVHYPCDMDAEQMYDHSMDYLLHNQYAFGSTSEDGTVNFYGSVHTGTGEPFNNGNAVYAMYGNSFSIAALNQYLKEFPDDAAAKERLAAVEGFLLDSDVRTPEGAYWSMLDIAHGKGYVDQAYRKWLETHATAWVTYYILDAFETSGNPRYREAAELSLKWMLSVQRGDGSLPKYFENGMPSSESMGDAAWAVLSFLKASQLGLGDEYKAAALKTLGWMEKDVIGTRQYCGSFEDVGGVNDSYCPSVTARAFILAYRCTGEASYIDSARKALSVSLAWITTDYTQTKYTTYNESAIMKPAYSQIESVTCYFPCSYTLAMMYLACAELGSIVTDSPEESSFWFGIADNLTGISDFMTYNNGSTKCRYGMEWLSGPFLVFSEWGNMQLCWTVRKIQEIRCPH